MPVSKKPVWPSARSRPRAELSTAIHAARARLALEASARAAPRGRLKLGLIATVVLIFYVVCWQLAQVDLVRLLSGLPKLGYWLVQAWPLKLDEMPLFLLRMGETIAMAAIG